MKTLFKNFVGWIDSQGTAFHANDVEKRKTTILIRACFLTGFFMLLYVGNCYLISFDMGLKIMPYEAVIFFSIPFLIRMGLSPKIAGHLYIINGTAFGVVLVWFSGGLQSPVTPWLTLMPICAILFMDARNAWIWAFIILAIVSAMGMYWWLVKPLPKDYNLSTEPLYFLNCYAGLIFIYLALSLIFEKRLNATINELEDSKTSLQELNNQLNLSLDTLKKTQAQLIQSEKMASLGEVTAGIAHEIQNPLNFVNNFAEVSVEMMEEIDEELEKGNLAEVKAMANDLKQNLQKIHHHGQRSSSIVKGMLEHSRKSSGKKELTDINALADEYLRLAYQRLCMKDPTFQSDFKTHFDPKLPKIDVIPQDIGRVLLNLITNGFQAVAEKAKSGIEDYHPELVVTTSGYNNRIDISVSDNGIGIPDPLKEKIFQPFFTTKPTGQGTGLGLSLAYDIVKAHGGELNVESTQQQGTSLTVSFTHNYHNEAY